MHRIIMLLACMVMFLVGSSCNLSKPEDVNKAAIEQILEQMAVDFRQLDLIGIMSFYAPDYVHNGTGISTETALWQNRMNQYTSFNFTNLSYDINVDMAIVSGTAKWSTETETISTTEPVENGDFSYFIKENGEWHIYGNHQTNGSSR